MYNFVYLGNLHKVKVVRVLLSQSYLKWGSRTSIGSQFDHGGFPTRFT